MQMKPEDLRQLRAWAIETSLGKAALGGQPVDMVKVIADARKLVNFVRSSR